MYMPKVLLTNGLYEIYLMRKMKETRITFASDDFRIIRTDDVDDAVTVDEDGYAYYIFTEQGTTLLGPSEATSILEQIFELTGKHVCDY
jgi:hypothetical protein